MTYAFGFRMPRLRRDPYADLMGSLDVRAQAPALEPSFQPMASMSDEAPRAPQVRPLPANVGTAADLDAERLSPSTAAIGDLLSREGQFREQGREAGSKASGANAFGVGLQAGGALNFSDEVAGLSRASGLPDWTPPLIAGPVGAARIGLDAAGVTSGRASQDYADQRDYARGYQEGTLSAQPLAAISGQVAGGLALPVGAGAATSVGRGLAAGAGYGAASGFGAGEDLAGRAEGAGIGGTIGGTLGAGFAGLAGRFAGRAAPDALPPLPTPVPMPAPSAARAAPAAASVASDVADTAPAVLPRSFDLPNSPQIPSLVSGPYGRAPTMAVDDGMEAIRAGILNNLADPSLGRAAAAATPAPTRTPLSFGPYGPKPTMSVEDGMEGIRSFLMPPSGWSTPVAPVVNARALGLGAVGAVGGAGAAMAGDGPTAAPGPADLARLFDRSPLGAPQGFSGTSGTVVAPAAPAPAGLATPVLPRPVIQTGELVSPDFRVPPAPEADKPTPGAVPVVAQMPPAASAPAAAPSLAERPAEAGGSMFSRLSDPRVYNTLLGIGQGLLTTKGFGAGLAAGTSYASRLNKDQAVTDLAQAEYGLKANKLRQESVGNNATLEALVRKGYSREDATAAIGASMAGNKEALSNMLNSAFRKTPDAPSGFSLKPDGTLGAIPGGPEDAAVKEQSAAATARGTASAKAPEDFSLPPGQTRYDGATGQPKVTAPKDTDAFDREGKLRGEFTKGLGTFNDVHDAYGRVIASTQQRAADPKSVSPAADISLIFSYMRMLDPGSVVREGEYATAKNAAGVPVQVQNLYNKALNGEFLQPEQRQDFLAQAERLYGKARSNAEAIAGRYRNLAGQYGVDPDRTAYLPDAPIAPQVMKPRAGVGAAPGRSDLEAEARRRGLLK